MLGAATFTRAHDLTRPRDRSCLVAPVRWVGGSQRLRKTVAMFSKQEQRTWIKIQCARGRMAKQCHRGLQEAWDAAALPYRTVATWVAAFRDGRERVEHMPRSSHPPVSDENVHLVSALVEVDWNITIRQLEEDTGLAHSTVLHILKDLLKMRKIASKCVRMI